MELDPDVRYFSNSELGTFKRCRRKWWLSYYRWLRPAYEKRTGVRGLGTRIHQALAVLYTPEPGDPLAVLELNLNQDRDELKEIQDWEGLAELEKDAELAKIMVEGYLEWIAEEGSDSSLTIIGSEVELAVPFLPKIQLIGKLDVRAFDESTGLRVFIDHKSVGSFAQAVAFLSMDQQMKMYHLLEILSQMEDGTPFAETEHCDGAIYNMLRRVKRTKTAKPPFYAREIVRHNTEELRNFYKQVKGTIMQIIQLQRDLDAGGDPHVHAAPSPRADCSWSCDFFLACPLFEDGSRVEAMLENVYVQVDPMTRYKTEALGLKGDVDESSDH